MREYLRRWPFLFLALPFAAAAWFFTYDCTRTSKRCIAVTTPDDVLVAVIVGAAIGLAYSVLLVWGAVYTKRQKEILSHRFPDSLIFSGRIDEVTKSAATSLGLDFPLRATLVGVASARGIQLWVGWRAERLSVDAGWSQVGAVDIGDPNGDVTRPARQSLDPVNYERLAIELSIDGVRAHLQFAVHNGTWGMTRSQLGDAYDVRKLVRQINGYRQVSERATPTTD